MKRDRVRPRGSGRKNKLKLQPTYIQHPKVKVLSREYRFNHNTLSSYTADSGLAVCGRYAMWGALHEV